MLLFPSFSQLLSLNFVDHFMFYTKINSFVFSHTDGKMAKNHSTFLYVCSMADEIINLVVTQQQILYIYSITFR